MRNPATAIPGLLFAAALSAACTADSPVPPLVAAAGWSWDPAAAGDRPLPVIWWGSTTPELLPLLPGGDCPTSGSVQAMAIANGKPTLAGISAACSSASAATMLPVVWSTGASGTLGVEQLALPPRATQGSALAVAEQGGDVFVGGAAGVESPLPMAWKNGRPAAAVASRFLPDGHDAGLMTSIVATDNFVVAGGVVHVTGSSPPAYSAVLWVLDLDLGAVVAQLVPLPAGVAAASFGPSVDVQVLGNVLLSTTSLATGAGLDKPVVWSDDVPLALLGLDFTAGPYGSSTGLRLVSGTPYVSGFVRPSGAAGLPAPALWGGTIQEILSTVDPSLGLGAAEALAILSGHAYVSGETYLAGTGNGAPFVSVPAWWDNGSRSDLAGLVPPGGGPTLSEPLFGWWRVPGTPSTARPDWPYAGGFAEIDAAPGGVAAAGSGVAKAIGVVPP